MQRRFFINLLCMFYIHNLFKKLNHQTKEANPFSLMSFNSFALKIPAL